MKQKTKLHGNTTQPPKTHATTVRAFVAAAALLLSSAAMGQSLTLLGNRPGYPVTYPLGISDDGRVITGQSEGGATFYAPFVASNGVRQELTTPSGLSQFYSVNVSGSGQYLAVTAVSSGRVDGQGGRYSISDGSYTLINSNFGSGWTGTSSALSRDGSVVAGWSENSNSTNYKAWYWSGTGNAVQITVGNNEPAVTRDISSNGRFICGDNPVTRSAPFVFDRQANTVIRLTGLGQARAINSAGNIVVGNALDSFGYSRPARWDNGVLQFVTDAYQNMGNFTARDVSADGSIITCSGVPGFEGPVSMVWSSSTGLMESKAYFESYGVQLPTGWSIGTGLYVSADGTTFTGGLYQGNVEQPFIITVPGAGGGCLTVGLVMAVGMRKRRS